MNKHVTTSQIGGSSWDRPEPSSDFVTKHPHEEVVIWRGIRDRVIALAHLQGWSKAEVARRVSMADSTFSQWLSGKFLGILANQNVIVSQWLEAVEQSARMASAIPASPAFIETMVAREINNTLLLVQLTSGFATVTLPAGRGKTTACRYFQATRPHVHMVTISPSTKTVHGVMSELARKLGVRVFNAAELTDAVGNKLSRVGDGSLLIIDEAQNLVAEAINQLRHFSDNYGCGIALVGNSEISRRLAQEVKASASRDQLTSRLDKNLKKDPGRAKDVALFISAWGIEDPKCVQFLTGLGMKGGALRQIDRTLKLAYLLIAGSGEELTLRDIEAAWKNRDVEDLA